jgi:hypothetical protein
LNPAPLRIFQSFDFRFCREGSAIPGNLSHTLHTPRDYTLDFSQKVIFATCQGLLTAAKSRQEKSGNLMEKGESGL